MTDEQIEDVTERTLSIGLRFAKWYIFQYVLLFCMPFIWGGSLCTGTAVCIAIYTLFYSLYWEFVPVKKRLNGLYLPLVPYIVLAFPCCLIWSEYTRDSISEHVKYSFPKTFYKIFILFFQKHL